jgi:hypothetical protein
VQTRETASVDGCDFVVPKERETFIGAGGHLVTEGGGWGHVGSRKPTRSCTSENDWFSEVESGVTSENTGVPSEPKRRGAQPTALPREYADFLAAYTGALADVPLAADTKRTYVSRVRMYLA